MLMHQQLNSSHSYYLGVPNFWSSWSAWGSCSASICGYGVSLRNRTCQGCVGGCPGNTTDSQSCIIKQCPVDCQLSWSAWSTCSASCGVGTQTREQYVSQPAMYGGAACPTILFNSMPCAQAVCNDCNVATDGPNMLGCFNGGICNDKTPYDGQFTCHCTSGFTGDNCQIGAT